MADISIIHNGSTDYNVKDAAGRLALAEVENKGAKNLVDTSTVVSGVVTFMQDSDYYVTASPNNTDPRLLEYANSQYKLRLPAGNYVLSMDITETTSQNNAICWVYKSDGTNIANKSIKGLSGLQTLQFTLSAETNIGILIKIYTAKLRLMICTKAEWDISHTYVPYGKTNAELTAENTSQQAEINYAVNTGAKNLIDLNPNAYTSGNVVVKLNYDGTVSVSLSSGSTANTTFSRAIKTITDLRDMDLILNGCPSGGNYSSGYALYISDDGMTKEKDEGNGVLVQKNTTVTTSYLALIVRSGTTISGTLTFKPMIRPAYITDSTFQPYSLSNPVLTAAAIKAVDEGAKNLVNAPSGSNIRFINIPIALQPGNYHALFQNVSSTDTDATTCQFGAFAEDDSTASSFPQLRRGNDTGSSFTVTKQTAYVRLYASNNFAAGAGDTVTFTGCMICTEADWAVSQKFVPYCPTNRELYEGELQTNSADYVNNLNATYVDKTNSAFVIRKYGKICFARISLKTVTSALTGSDTISSTALPVELCPDVAVYTLATTRDVGGWAAATYSIAAITIDTNGNVVLRTGTAKTSAVYVTGYVSWYAPNGAVSTRFTPSENLTKGTVDQEDESEILTKVEAEEKEEQR